MLLTVIIYIKFSIQSFNLFEAIINDTDRQTDRQSDDQYCYTLPQSSA